MSVIKNILTLTIIFFIYDIKSKEELNSNINYDFQYDNYKIEQILKDLKIPNNYNFLNYYNPVETKDQQYCGSCWAMASATSLSYRYRKKGFKLDLSPQYLLSCYHSDCDIGLYETDPQFFLYNSGIVTEECFPFSSGYKTIKSCPKKCIKDEIPFNKYKAKNAYIANIDKNNFYEMMEIIFYELYNNGPITAGFVTYDDFMSLDKNICNKDNYIYSHNWNFPESRGGHDVVIVGYGYLNSKYYFLVQNSWGKDFCNNGFVKMEINQIESFSFSEPYLKKINVNDISIDKNCNLNIDIPQMLDEIDIPLSITFKHKDNLNSLKYQCGGIKLPNKQSKTIHCFFEQKEISEIEPGTYNFFDIQSFTGQYTYVYKNKNVSFIFKNRNVIIYSPTANSYISGLESKIIFSYDFHKNYYKDSPAIYISNTLTNQLSNCNYFKFNNLKYINCNIKESDLKLFKNNGQTLFYETDCGNIKSIGLKVSMIDTTQYPIFRVKTLTIPKEEEFSDSSIFIIGGDIEGSIKNYNTLKKGIMFFLRMHTGSFFSKKIMEYDLVCNIEHNSIIRTSPQFQFQCYIDFPEIIKKKDIKKYVLLIYSMALEESNPYEIIIPNEISVEFSTVLHQKVTLYFIILILLLF